MTANVSIIVSQKDEALKVPNAAIRFTPPKPERVEAGAPGTSADRVASGGQTPGLRVTHGDMAGAARRVWKLGPSGDPEAVPIQTGVSDGTVTEIVGGDLKEGDHVIVGLESPRGARRTEALPPGFGTGQRRHGSRDRGL
jgi:HlyD family secretion protein